MTKVAHQSDKLVISWNDGHESQFEMEWLRKNAPKPKNGRQYISQDKEECFWSDSLKSISEIVDRSDDPILNPMDFAIPYTDFMKAGDEGVHQLLSNILQFGYGIVKDSPPDFETTKQVISKVSHPQNTIFGDFSEWTSNLAHADTAYTSDFVHLHTDTSYFTEPIGYIFIQQ